MTVRVKKITNSAAKVHIKTGTVGNHRRRRRLAEGNLLLFLGFVLNHAIVIPIAVMTFKKVKIPSQTAYATTFASQDELALKMISSSRANGSGQDSLFIFQIITLSKPAEAPRILTLYIGIVVDSGSCLFPYY